MKNIKRIFSKSTAMMLIEMDNDMLYTEPNMKKPKLVLYVFRLNQKLLDDLTEITLKDKEAGNTLK